MLSQVEATMKWKLCSIILILVSAVIAFGQTTPTSVPNYRWRLTPIGLAATETIQINVLNTANPTVDGPPTGPCLGSVNFYDADGLSIRQTPFSLAGGQVISVKLPYGSTKASGLRTLVGPEVSIATLFSGFVLPGPCALKFSVETYDTLSGTAHASYTGVLDDAMAPSASEARFRR